MSAFTTDGVSDPILVPAGYTWQYVLSGTWVAIVALEKKMGTGWREIRRYTANASVIMSPDRVGEAQTYRLRCIVCASGQVDYTMALATVEQDFPPVVDENGVEQFGVDENGLRGVNLTLTGFLSAALIRLLSESVTAHAGGTKAAALALSAAKTLHIVAVCATADDSVLLPTVVADEVHRIINQGAAALRVFSNGTSTINGINTATGISIPVGEGRDFHGGTAGAAGTWVMATAPAAFDPASPGIIGNVSPSRISGTKIFADNFWTKAEGKTAHAGGGEADATEFSTTASVHVVEICATNGDSAKIGQLNYDGEHVPIHYLINDGAANLQLFSANGTTINGTDGFATGVSLATGKAALLIGVSTTAWRLIVLN